MMESAERVIDGSSAMAVNDSNHQQPVHARDALAHPIPSYAAPYEILDTIFRLTQPPPHEYGPSLTLGPRSPWVVGLRTKKALTLVCKAWSGLATAFLYEDVVFRRMGQICAFEHTLLHSNPSRDIVQLVRRIRIVDCIVLRHCADAVRRSLWTILFRCSALKSFSYHPAPRSLYPFDVDQDPELPRPRLFNVDPRWMLSFDIGRPGHSLKDQLDSGLQVLDLNFSDIQNTDWFVGPLYAMLSHATHITTLVLDAFEMKNNRDEWLLSAPSLQFPALESLHVHPRHWIFCDWMARRWELPKLTSLTYRSDIDPVGFIESHGAHVTYAYFDCGSHLLPHLSRILPVVEHLTLPLYFELEALEINSPTLRYLDILREGYPAFSHYRSVFFVSTSQIPALKRFRLLGYGAWEVAAQYPKLISPELLPPDVEGPESLEVHRSGGQNASEEQIANENPWDDWVTGGVVHHVHGTVLRQKWWGVAHDPWWCPDYVLPDYQRAPRGDVDSDSDDGSYVYGSPSDSDSETETETETASASDSDRSKETSTSESARGKRLAAAMVLLNELYPAVDPDPEQLDCETVLRMFRVGAAGDFMLVDESDSERLDSEED